MNCDRSKARADSTAVVQVTASLELFHAFAIVQDDVMHGSATRRGLPAMHHRIAGQHAEHPRCKAVGRARRDLAGRPGAGVGLRADQLRGWIPLGRSWCGRYWMRCAPKPWSVSTWAWPRPAPAGRRWTWRCSSPMANRRLYGRVPVAGAPWNPLGSPTITLVSELGTDHEKSATLQVQAKAFDAPIGDEPEPAPDGYYSDVDNPKLDSSTRLPELNRWSALFPSFGAPPDVRPRAERSRAGAPI
ncbi:polyprenyl synthetase family protein [Umezawaea endophytica]|uniref:polyprenyl synthetase family protein n=1 Tax=Umezawaea endophytica TaxID=1654476 RepID=UPI003555C80C